MTGRQRVALVVSVAVVTAVVSLIVLRPRHPDSPPPPDPARPLIVDGPVLEVVIAYPGATPAQVEADVTIPAEDALDRVAGLQGLRSASTAGEARLLLEVATDRDPAAARAAIEQALAQIRFPEAVRAPTVALLPPGPLPP